MIRQSNLLLFIALTVVATALFFIEKERVSVSERSLMTEDGSVTLYENRFSQDGSLVVVAHGFAGSRQMMQYISRDLARAGFVVAAFDFFGHGRNTALLSPNVSSIDGTTQQLVEQTRKIVRSVRSALYRKNAEFALLGHSMATDIIIRVAETAPEARSIVAISMYSDIVTPEFPDNLLMISGSWEGRLRDVGLRLSKQVDPSATEGQTVSNGLVARRTVAIPFTEHVAVLFRTETMREAGTWLGETLTRVPVVYATGQSTGWAVIGLLVGIIASAFLFAQKLPSKASQATAMTLGPFVATLIAATLISCGSVYFAPSDILGLSAFGSLLVFFFTWGAVLLASNWTRANFDRHFDLLGFAFILVAGALFALAMDRYAAAFLPSGPRWLLMAVLLPATMTFAIADRVFVAGAPLWQRGVARVAVVSALGGCMVITEGNFGLLFTVVPVLCLFFLVYGTMARPVAKKRGPLCAGCALGVILAWAVSASTPLFSVS